MSNINSDITKDQLEELELNGELPSIEMQAAGSMFHQNAELMRRHEKEIQSMLINSNESALPWGSWDCTSYQVQQYGGNAIEQMNKNDPIHEMNSLKSNIVQVTADIRRTKKRLMTSTFSASGKIRKYEREVREERGAQKMKEINFNRRR